MHSLDELITDIRSRLSGIAAAVAKLPTAEDVPDETYVKLWNFVQQSLQKAITLLDDADFSESERILLHDVRGAIASLFACSEIMNEQCADHLSAEQQDAVQAMQQLSSDLLEHLSILAGHEAQVD
ncbi:MAG: hypothetical protein R3E39_28720 [Anaerolineae bacterium]